MPWITQFSWNFSGMKAKWIEGNSRFRFILPEERDCHWSDGDVGSEYIHWITQLRWSFSGMKAEWIEGIPGCISVPQRGEILWTNGGVGSECIRWVAQGRWRFSGMKAKWIKGNSRLYFSPTEWRESHWTNGGIGSEHRHWIAESRNFQWRVMDWEFLISVAEGSLHLEKEAFDLMLLSPQQPGWCRLTWPKHWVSYERVIFVPSAIVMKENIREKSVILSSKTSENSYID
ncbi:uncharacterized protein LOC126087670 [Elephas maximus indicus]|uniref:uncharacterized protein LOC126087670 n=1 Tax=Elephas maximus indicus TaxID=99487 RepID=UPI0021162CFB|nr:uncharacterized protein LOC126087670 [Elephas maximus indicus]XP_049761185.1 uncharacterized protein LOC126087670 [Elephas maximus indicus]